MIEKNGMGGTKMNPEAIIALIEKQEREINIKEAVKKREMRIQVREDLKNSDMSLGEKYNKVKKINDTRVTQCKASPIITFKIPRRKLDIIDTLVAEELFMSRSEFIRQAIDNYLESYISDLVRYMR